MTNIPSFPYPSLPRLWCDFNACGWSGETNDDCYYSLHREQLAALPPVNGLCVLLWDQSDDENVIAVEATLEPFDLHPRPKGWRARPKQGTWYEGPPDDAMKP